MRVGLGTGSTAYYAIVALGERKPDITCVATSVDTEKLARSYGLKVVDPGDVDGLDIDIDGADEVDSDLNLTKGGGGAHAREKVVANMAGRFFVVVDDSKLVERLCEKRPLPVEVLEFAEEVVRRDLERLGATDVSRRDHLSDNNNPILDAQFPPIADPEALKAALDATPGIVEHGIFLVDMVHEVIVGTAEGDARTISP